MDIGIMNCATCKRPGPSEAALYVCACGKSGYADGQHRAVLELILKQAEVTCAS
jgi:hypothetical protein